MNVLLMLESGEHAFLRLTEEEPGKIITQLGLPQPYPDEIQGRFMAMQKLAVEHVFGTVKGEIGHGQGKTAEEARAQFEFSRTDKELPRA